MDISNTNYEHILLNTLFTDPKVFTKTLPILKKDYFINPANQRIFKEIKDYYTTYNTIPGYVEIISKIKEIPDAEARKKIAENLGLISKVEKPKNPEANINSIVDFARNAIFTEAILKGSDGIQFKNESDLLKSWELMESAFRVSIDSDLGLSYDDIESRIEYYVTALTGILTSDFHELNKRLGPGFLGGTLSVILAASGIGKSLMMTGLISDFIRQGKNVLLVSMEMSAHEIVKRVDANVLNIPINSLTRSKVDTTGKRVDENFNLVDDKIDLQNDPVAKNIRDSYNKVKDGLGKFYTKAYAPGTFSSLMLDDLLNTYETEKNTKFDLVFLDYLGIMKSDRLPFSAGLYNYVKSIAEEVRSIAVKRDIAVISASQLNRSGFGNLGADNSAVADSVGTVQTADFLLFLLQTEELKAQNIINFKVTKNRFNGRTDDFNMSIDYEYMRFTDCPQITDPTEKAALESALSAMVQEEHLKALDASRNSMSVDSWESELDDILKDFK